MKKFIVPLDITVHFSCEVEAENKVEALQMAIDKVEFEDIDWNCNRAHMVSKWIYAVRDNASDSYMPRFYAELSSDNRQRLIKWVMKHYTDEQKFSFQRLNSED